MKKISLYIFCLLSLYNHAKADSLKLVGEPYQGNTFYANGNYYELDIMKKIIIKTKNLKKPVKKEINSLITKIFEYLNDNILGFQKSEDFKKAIFVQRIYESNITNTKMVNGFYESNITNTKVVLFHYAYSKDEITPIKGGLYGHGVFYGEGFLVVHKKKTFCQLMTRRGQEYSKVEGKVAAETDFFEVPTAIIIHPEDISFQKEKILIEFLFMAPTYDWYNTYSIDLNSGKIKLVETRPRPDQGPSED